MFVGIGGWIRHRAEGRQKAAITGDRLERKDRADYEKAFNTQIIIVSIIGLFLAGVGKFGVDHIVQSKLTEASTKLREDFTAQLAAELQKLKDSNAAQAKELENALRKLIDQATDDLETKSDFQFHFNQGMAAEADQDAADRFHAALRIYKDSKPRQLIGTRAAVITARNIFSTLKRAHQDDFTEIANKELDDPIYDDLQEELALAALELKPLATLLEERKKPRPAAQPAMAHSAPATAKESNAPAPDKDQGESEKK